MGRGARGYLALYDAAGGTLTPLLGGGDAIYDPPSWCPDGQALLFASDRSGVFDIYRDEFGSGRITRLTRTLTGLFYPMASAADAVTAMLYTADGYRLARLDELAEEPGGALWLLLRPRCRFPMRRRSCRSSGVIPCGPPCVRPFGCRP